MNRSLAAIWNGVRQDMQPLRSALASVLTAITGLAILGLVGLGLVRLGQTMGEPYGLLVGVTGEALLMGGALFALRSSVQAWWGLFKDAGYLGRTR